MSRWKNSLFIVLLGLLFFEVLVVFPRQYEKSVEKETQEKVDIKKRETEANQTMSGIHLLESKAGQKDWELRAESAAGYGHDVKSNNWSLKKLDLLFYRQNSAQIDVKGNLGAIEAETKNIHLSGEVVAHTSNNYRFYSDKMDYISQGRLLKSPVPVHMVGPKLSAAEDLDVKGDELIVDIEKGVMTIEKKVNAIRNLPDGRHFKINCDQAEFSDKSNSAKFFGNVRMVYQDSTIRGKNANFDFDPKTRQLRSVLFMNGVEVENGDKTAAADMLQVDLLESKIVFRGHPRLKQDDDVLVGEEIIFFDGGKRVKIEKARARVEDVEQSEKKAKK